MWILFFIPSGEIENPLASILFPQGRGRSPAKGKGDDQFIIPFDTLENAYRVFTGS
jgi:hypothetical protein